MGNNSSSHSASASASASGSSTARRARASSEPVQPPTTTVDGGFIEPQSMLYASSAQEYSRPTVHKLILERRLAPFFLGLNDFEPDWTVEQVVAALEEGDRQATQNLREALAAASEAATEAEVVQLSNPPTTRKGKDAAAATASAVLHRERLAELIKFKDKRGGGLQWSSKADQARRYLARAIECPICFLYYPPTLVHTRCCDQPICTECFVQIKRAEPDATHLKSEPAACPFCMEPNFGCSYIQEKTEISRPGMSTSNSASSAMSSQSGTTTQAEPPKPRRKSFAHTEKHVVTTDQLHPDWEAKVEAVRATVARRANRRIVFRQVGDRLVPVGITSGREGDGANATMSTAALPPGFAAQVAAALGGDGASSGSGREGRRATRRRNAEMAQYLESMGIGVGQDLEEMMVAEAVRLSMVEDEERRKKAADDAAANGTPETSAQGALRAAETAPTTTTRSPPSMTAALLSDAIAAPMGAGSLLDASPLASTSSLPSLPVLQPTSRPSSRPSSASGPASGPANTHRVSALGALAAGGVAAVAVTPSANSEFPKPGESTTGSLLGRGLVNAGLTGSIPARRISDAASTPPQLPAITPHAPIDAPATQLPDDVASSALFVGSPLATRDVREPSPSLISLGTSSIGGSSIRAPTTARGDSDDEEPPLTPSQGYQPLEDDDDDSDSAPKGLGADERREEVAVPTRMAPQSLVNSEG